MSDCTSILWSLKAIIKIQNQVAAHPQEYAQ